jgi:hypothetical protein
MGARERFRDLPHGVRASDRIAVGDVAEDEPIDAPDPDTLPNANEVRRLAGLDRAEREPEPTPEPTPEPEPTPIVAIEEVFEPTFEVHPEADANPHAGPPPGWPTRSQPVEPTPPPKPTTTKRSPAPKQPSPPVADEQAPGLGVLPDL